MRSRLRLVGVLAALALASPAAAQVGTIKKGLTTVGKTTAEGLSKTKDVMVDLAKVEITPAEEQQLGLKVSTQLRQKYGVAQSASVHKYVAQVGTVLAKASTRPGIKWTFIVLDTDGVNAFAAPGGYVHITRGALAMMQNESELAGVLGHEIAHVTLQHTIAAIKKGKRIEKIAGSTRLAIITALADKVYETVFENAYDRGDEKEADRDGIALANTVGYAPAGLGAFLTRLDERNKGLKDRSGWFASHPETKDRIDELKHVIEKQKLAARGVVGERFKKTITYKPIPVDDIEFVAGAEGASGAMGADAKKAARAQPAQPAKTGEAAKSGGSKFGLTKLTTLGKEKQSNATVASAGSRGVNPDRDAKGGSNPALVAVTVSAAELTAFKKGIVPRLQPGYSGASVNPRVGGDSRR